MEIRWAIWPGYYRFRFLKRLGTHPMKIIEAKLGRKKSISGTRRFSAVSCPLAKRVAREQPNANDAGRTWSYEDNELPIAFRRSPN